MGIWGTGFRFFFVFLLWVSAVHADQLPLIPVFQEQFNRNILFPKDFPKGDAQRREFQKQFKVSVQNGVLVDAHGKAITTDPSKVYNFIEDLKGNRYVADSSSPLTSSHAYLSLGKPIICGGEIQVIDGKVTYLSNKSGHYHPGVQCLENLEHRFEQESVLHPTRYQLDAYDSAVITQLKPPKHSDSESESVSSDSGYSASSSGYRDESSDYEGDETSRCNPHPLDSLTTPIAATLLNQNGEAAKQISHSKLLEITRGQDGLFNFSSSLKKLCKRVSWKERITKKTPHAIFLDSGDSLLRDFLNHAYQPTHRRIRLFNGKDFLLPREEKERFQQAFEAHKKEVFAKVDHLLNQLERNRLQIESQMRLRETPFLPGIRKVHLIWIGSPLPEAQIADVSTLCRKIREVEENEARPAEKKKILLWKDSRFLGDSPFVDESRLNPACTGILEVHEVSELFKGGEVAQMEEISSALHELRDFQIGVEKSCDRLDGSAAHGEKLEGPLPKSLEEIYNWLSRRSDLGGVKWAPMADLIRLLTVYEHGGAYFDIKKNFGQMKFISNLQTFDQPLKGSELFTGGSVSRPESLPSEVLRENDYHSTFFESWLAMDELGSATKESDHTFFSKSGSITTARRKSTSFRNNDFFATPHPHSSTIHRILSDITDNYATFTHEPLLRMFIQPEHFSSMVWVFSIGGPGAFTSSIAKDPSVKPFTVSTGTLYKGTASWRSKTTPLGILLLKEQLRKTAEKSSNRNEIESIMNHCWDQNRAYTNITGAPPQFERELGEMRLQQDAEFCFFNSLRKHLPRFSSETRAELNRFGRSFSAHYETMDRKIKDRCGSYSFDHTLETIHCGSEKISVSEFIH